MSSWRKTIPGRGKRRRRGPEVTVILIFKNQRAGPCGCAREGWVGDEVTEIVGWPVGSGAHCNDFSLNTEGNRKP